MMLLDVQQKVILYISQGQEIYLWHKFTYLPVSSILGNFVKHLVVVLQENQLVHSSSDEHLHNLQ